MSSALNAYTQFTKFDPNPMQEELFNAYRRNKTMNLHVPPELAKYLTFA